MRAREHPTNGLSPTPGEKNQDFIEVAANILNSDAIHAFTRFGTSLLHEPNEVLAMHNRIYQI